MCGIAGYWDKTHALSPDYSRAVIDRMTDVIRHRGPDDEGQWQDDTAGITLGFRRLAIIDLSSQGHQPMLSASGRYAIIFNGEIYNYQQIRAEVEVLEPSTIWRGHSDTEVLLAAIERWGVEGTLKRANGMFALALWDKFERTLTLARDRMGEKPLYFGWLGNTFVFGSELKSLQVHPNWGQSISREAVGSYVTYGYVPAPMSIWQGVQKLRPAHYLIITSETVPGSLPESTAYWSLSASALRGVAAPLIVSEHELIEQLEFQIDCSVRSRMGADVPLGAFLSGGIDSSLIAALMQKNASRPVRTFSIGFWEDEFDEAPHAAAVAKVLGTVHEEFYVTADDALSVIPTLPRMYDEPFGDASQIPTHLLSALASNHVTVALSGDGGDELFFGYERYFRALRIWGYCSRFPLPLRQSLASGASRVSRRTWDNVMSILPKRARVERFGDRIQKLAELVDAPADSVLYSRMLSHARDLGAVMVDAPTVPDSAKCAGVFTDKSGMADRMMLIDQLNYLPDDILTKVDRASMAASLECRAPYLDHELVDFSWRIPSVMRSVDGRGKWPLRQVLQKYVPAELTDRPKKGFGIPIIQWLRGPLREWGSELLGSSRLKDEGLFSPDQAQADWRDTLSGERDRSQHLWNLLMFEAWREEAGSSGKQGFVDGPRRLKSPAGACSSPTIPS